MDDCGLVMEYTLLPKYNDQRHIKMCVCDINCILHVRIRFDKTA